MRIAYADKGYRGDGAIPDMPDSLWIAASQRYVTIYEMLTGQTFEPGDYPIGPRLGRGLNNIRMHDWQNPLLAL